MENDAEIGLNRIGFYRELEFEMARLSQKQMAEKIGDIYGVKAFVGFEVSGAGNHKNCFSTETPVIEYARFKSGVTNEQAIMHLQDYGSTYSWNHPFSKYGKTGKSKKEIFDMVKADLLENRVYGAHLIETGFPVGRDGFDANDYLKLWDCLSENGIMITGYGDSDNHHAVSDGWISGNNFCGFAGMEDDDSPTEENFIKAFKRGNLWSGNPVLIRNLTFKAGEKPQGSLVRGKSVEVEFSATDINCEGYAVCISNGEMVNKIPFKDGNVMGQWVLECSNRYNFARVELYDDKNMLIAFSNPIYLVGVDMDIQERQ